MRKKLVIARRNEGFGDNLMNAANAWLYAKKNNRALIIGWYKSIYLGADNWVNAFYYYFNFPDNLQGVPIVKNNIIPFFISRIIAQIREKIKTLLYGSNQKFKDENHQDQMEIITGQKNANRYFLNFDTCLGPNIVDANQLRPFFEALTLRNDLAERVEKFIKEKFHGKKTIGVHIRYYPAHLQECNYSKHWLNEEVEIQRIENTIENELNQMTGEYVLFLCTDSPQIQLHFQQKFKNLIFYFELPADARDEYKELHTSNISIEAAENSLIEMFLLSKCNTLIRNTGSWFNFYASLKVAQVITVSDIKESTKDHTFSKQPNILV